MVCLPKFARTNKNYNKQLHVMMAAMPTVKELDCWSNVTVLSLCLHPSILLEVI